MPFYDYVCQACKARDGEPLMSEEEWALQSSHRLEGAVGTYEAMVDRVNIRDWAQTQMVPMAERETRAFPCRTCEGPTIRVIGNADGTCNFFEAYCYGRGSKKSTHMKPSEVDHKRKWTYKNGMPRSQRLIDRHFKKPAAAIPHVPRKVSER